MRGKKKFSVPVQTAILQQIYAYKTDERISLREYTHIGNSLICFIFNPCIPL